MGQSTLPDVIVYLCSNSIPSPGTIPSQWDEEGARVLVQQIPCSGKNDAEYLFHALEGGARGLCVVTCPKGTCRLAQGNYRAEVRVGMLRRLLEEVGLEAERVEFVRCEPGATFEEFEQAVRDATERISALGEIPIAKE